ncbi:hypothetical protein Q9233_011946 [Columba guinea]|nr:hypothetical protein Q9233_011946 [Columba guinea]
MSEFSNSSKKLSAPERNTKRGLFCCQQRQDSLQHEGLGKLLHLRGKSLQVMLNVRSRNTGYHLIQNPKTSICPKDFSKEVQADKSTRQGGKSLLLIMAERAINVTSVFALQYKVANSPMKPSTKAIHSVANAHNSHQGYRLQWLDDFVDFVLSFLWKSLTVVLRENQLEIGVAASSEWDEV